VADHAKDSKKQEILRRKLQSHPIWQYPPEERLQHDRERLEIFELVMECKGVSARLENRLNNTPPDTGLLADEEKALREVRFNPSQARSRFDGVAFTESVNKAIAHYDPAAGKEFMAYLDAIYANAMRETANSQAMRAQGDVRLNREEAEIWKVVCLPCEKQGKDPAAMPEAFYKGIAESMGKPLSTVKSVVCLAATVRRTVSLNSSADDEDGKLPDAADPNQRYPQDRLEKEIEVMEVIERFADKERKEYPRIFFTNDTLNPLCDDRPAALRKQECAVLEKREQLLWNRIFDRGYIDFVFCPQKPARLRAVPDTPLTRPLQDSSIAAYRQISPAAVSYQRRRYKAMMNDIWRELCQ